MASTLSSSSQSYSVSDLQDASKFNHLFYDAGELGSGSDGAVTRYKHRRQNNVVFAVKIAKNIWGNPEERTQQEIRNLERVGNKQPNVCGMVASCEDFKDGMPAIIFEVSQRGDLIHYCEAWGKQQEGQGKSTRISEVTLLNIFRDMIRALDHLHNSIPGTAMVHTDIKPANILVFTPPPNDNTDIVPTEATFKLCDFTRLGSYPKLPGEPPKFFSGTYTYAPPWEERRGVPRPAGDIYSLGATIQTTALWMRPTKRFRTFIAERQAAGLPIPSSWAESEADNYWQERIPVVYRPIDVSPQELVSDWDVPDESHLIDYKPYSSLLNQWYSMLLEPDAECRPTAKYLAEYVVPKIELLIPVAKDLEFKMGQDELAERIREEVVLKDAGMDESKVKSTLAAAADYEGRRWEEYETITF